MNGSKDGSTEPWQARNLAEPINRALAYFLTSEGGSAHDA